MVATVYVTLGKVRERAVGTGQTLPLEDSVPDYAEAVTASAVSAVTTTVAPTELGVWTVLPVGGPVRMKAGTGTPDATTGARRYLAAGIPVQYAVTTESEKLAFVDA